MSLYKNHLTSLGSNFTDHKKLGFKDEATIAKDHKSIDLKYLRQLNRMVAWLLHDTVFEPSIKVDTPAQSKLNGILRNSEVSQLLFSRRRRRGMTCSAVEDPRSADLGQDVPQVRGHDRHANGHHDGRATIITCVTGDAHHRRTIYEADQDFERFGKTLIVNFKDTATLWEFLRAILRQCHIHKLSKVGKDKTAWAKADEYLTNLMDSNTVFTLENTDEAIKRPQNYMQRQDNDGEKHVTFSSVSDESNDGEEVKALRTF